MMRAPGSHEGKDKILLYAGVAVALAGLALFLMQVRSGLHLFEFGDEAEKFVAAQMIGEGLRLYRDIFAHHGPLPYMVAHLYTLLVSPTDFSDIRLFQALLALISCAAVITTPVLKSPAARAWSAATYLMLLATIWVLQGMHMVVYPAIGGFLLIVPLLHVFVPLLFDERPCKYGVLASGIALALACFTAYALGPSTILIVGASAALVAAGTIRDAKAVLYWLAGGIALGAGVMVLWLLLFGDIKGFLVYHFYFNQAVYAKFIGFSPIESLNLLAFSFAPNYIVHALALILCTCWVTVFLVVVLHLKGTGRLRRKLFALLIFVASVFLVNPRGGLGFHDTGFIIANVGLFAFACGLLMQRTQFRRVKGLAATLVLIAASVVGLETASNHANSSPYGVRKHQLHDFPASMKPGTGETYDFIRSITRESGDVLSLVFNPAVYIKLGRLPASGNYYYLPWQAAYMKRPIAGYSIDLCADIRTRAPAVIWFDNWKVWNVYDIHDYEPCVTSLIGSEYAPLGGPDPWFVRKDILANLSGASAHGQSTLRPSTPLASAPIPLRMSSAALHRTTPLRRLGVMLGTHNRKNSGEGALRLEMADGNGFTKQFALTDVRDNKYHYFSLDPGLYITGSIVPVSGGGISTWEIHGGQDSVLTCLVYEYADNSRLYTPGCPLF